MERKWSVNKVQSTEEGGYRFVLCVEFDYASYAEAEAGRKKLLEALKSAATVKHLTKALHNASSAN
jgi:hypothetical protein